MREFLKVAVVLSFMAFGILGLVSKSFATLYSVAVNKDSRAESTREIFLQNCARCHGSDGHGETEQGRKYNVPDLVKEAKDASSSKLTRIITKGRHDMPAFGKKLTRKQITALAAFVRKL